MFASPVEALWRSFCFLVTATLVGACAATSTPPLEYELEPLADLAEPQLPPNLGVGWFGGLSAGQSVFHDYEESPGDDVDGEDPSYATFAGFQFNRHWATVVGWIDHGKLEASGPGGGGFTDEIHYQSTIVGGVGIAPFHPRAAAYGLTGFAYWHQDVDYQDASGPFTASEYGFSPMIGGGVNWYLDESKHFGVDVSWVHIFEAGDFDATGHDSDLDYVSIGLVVHQ